MSMVMQHQIAVIQAKLIELEARLAKLEKPVEVKTIAPLSLKKTA